jgi:fatty acid desaturase
MEYFGAVATVPGSGLGIGMPCTVHNVSHRFVVDNIRWVNGDVATLSIRVVFMY